MLRYLWWAFEVALIHLFLGYTWSICFCSITLVIELIYFMINKYFKSLIDMFGATWLRTITFQIKDYKRFWTNYILRVIMYLLGLIVAVIVRRFV